MRTHRVTRGLDLPLKGAPEPVVEDAAPCRRVGVLAADHVGLKPRLLVAPGDRVRLGQPLFEDRAAPGVTHVAPAAGVVAAVNRGERRALLSVVIDVEEAGETPAPFAAFDGADPASAAPERLRALLLESGLWTALRTRPFSRTPQADATPDALFVTAMDTRPHAPPIEAVLDGRMDDFRAGVAALARMTGAPTHVCVAPGARVAVPEERGVSVEVFEGPHPAGVAGTHIHMLRPVGLGRTVWHVGAQDVAEIGRLVATGRRDPTRVISLAGPGALRPRLLRTRLGAATDDLARGELAPGPQRVISGSALDGRAAAGPIEGYLGRWSSQLSVVPEPQERELFGWIRPGGEKYSIWGVVLNAFRRAPSVAMTTSTNGGHRAMVPIGSFERVMPLDIMPTFLLRALLMNDAERAEALGALELDEEDLALCTFVCPGKEEYGPLLRAMLTRLEKEAA